MKIIIYILILIVVSVVFILAARKLIECIVNLIIVFKKGKHPDLPMQRHGIVFNKKSGKLEADQTCILPF